MNDRNKSGKAFEVVPFEEVERRMDLAMRHAGEGRLEESIRLLESLLIPDMIKKFPDLPHHQFTVTNLGMFLSDAGRHEEAVNTLSLLEGGNELPVEWYLNYSRALNLTWRFRRAEGIAMEGLRAYPEERELAENLQAALINQKRHPGKDRSP